VFFDEVPPSAGPEWVVRAVAVLDHHPLMSFGT